MLSKYPVVFHNLISQMERIVQYIIVRGDLSKILEWPIGAVITQCCHASTAICNQTIEDPDTRSYFNDLDNMHKVVLEILWNFSVRTKVFVCISMSLKRFYLRYYPPGKVGFLYIFHFTWNETVDNLVSPNGHFIGIGLCYVDNNLKETTNMIDLLDLTTSSKLDHAVEEILKTELKLNPEIVPKLKESLVKLQNKLKESTKTNFYHFKTLKNHLLPLTNVTFDKTGGRFITGSYDRTCRVWNVETGNETMILTGHENAVFSVNFNYPKCDRVVTGSFDKTAKIWNPVTGNCIQTFYGHTAEVVAAEFNSSSSDVLATCSMDSTARIYHVETGQETHLLNDHYGEVISAHFSKDGKLLLTGSFDNNAFIWDLRSKEIIMELRGHAAELSNCIWNFECSMVATSSLDTTARVWDLRNLNCMHVITGHKDEVLDICFDYTGRRLATASSDCTAKIWDVSGAFDLLSVMGGHLDEVSKICFSPPGNILVTASADKTCRLWNTKDGNCLQILQGHTADVFSCAINYFGDAVVTVSKDNTCKIWR